MSIRYQDTSEGVTPEHLDGGFFVGWQKPRTAAEHLEILQNSDYLVLALDDRNARVVGYITVLTDGVQAAFISLLEVLPEFQGQGIGTSLMGRVKAKFEHLPALDLMCNPNLQPFYARFGMRPSVGMVLRNY